jgi:beta-galactosidase
MAVLINTKKKFREDCTRALLRPYNFFADVRDHRIISGVHTAILMLIQAGSVSLLMTILLYFYKSNILLEKIVLSFGNHSLLKFVSFLSWNPLVCFALLFVLIIIKFALISSVIKFASLLLKTRVEFASIFYTVVWAFLPFTILLPVELILFKILVNENFSVIVIIFLILFMLWILQRILKGIYVIFDVRPMKVYIYSFLVIILVVGVILLKYQLTSSTLYYINNAFKQYNSMIF